MNLSHGQRPRVNEIGARQSIFTCHDHVAASFRPVVRHKPSAWPTALRPSQSCRKLITMKHKFPQTLGLLLISLSLSACVDSSQSAVSNGPTASVTPAAAESPAKKESDTTEPVML